MKVRGETALWPPNPAPHVIDWFREIGPTTAGPMGEAAITWEEMVAWERVTGIELSAWEARTIRRLSQAFIAQRHDAERPDCTPPYSGVSDQIEVVRDRVTSQFAAMFSALADRSAN